MTTIDLRWPRRRGAHDRGRVREAIHALRPRALPVLEKAFRQELRDDCASRPEEKVSSTLPKATADPSEPAREPLARPVDTQERFWLPWFTPF